MAIVKLPEINSILRGKRTALHSSLSPSWEEVPRSRVLQSQPGLMAAFIKMLIYVDLSRHDDCGDKAS